MGKKIYKLTVEPITCVHIGTGKQLTLLDYTVKETNSGTNKYIHFSADSILNRIAGEPGKIQEFDIASSSGNMKDFIKSIKMSSERTRYDNALIPSYTRLEGVTVTGAE